MFKWSLKILELVHLLRDWVSKNELLRTGRKFWWKWQYHNSWKTHLVTLKAATENSSSTHANEPVISKMDLRWARTYVGFSQSFQWTQAFSSLLVSMSYLVWCLQNWHFIFRVNFGLHLLPGPFWVLKQNPAAQSVEQVLKLPSKSWLFKRLNYHKMWQQRRLMD